MSTSRSIYCHSSVDLNLTSISSNAPASSGAYSNQVQKIKRLSEFTAVVQASRYTWQILQADSNMTRPFFKYCPSLVLRHLPPGSRFSDRNERGTGGVRSHQAGLPGYEFINFGSVRIPRVTCYAAKDPFALIVQFRSRSFQYIEPLSHRQSQAGDFANSLDLPQSGWT